MGMKKINDLIAPIWTPANVISKKCTDEKPLIFIPNDKSYIQILDHKINESFDSFEDFCIYLRHIKDVEEENKQLRDDKNAIVAYLLGKINEAKIDRIYENGNSYATIQERIYQEILDKIDKIEGSENQT